MPCAQGLSCSRPTVETWVRGGGGAWRGRKHPTLPATPAPTSAASAGLGGRGVHLLLTGSVTSGLFDLSDLSFPSVKLRVPGGLWAAPHTWLCARGAPAGCGIDTPEQPQRAEQLGADPPGQAGFCEGHRDPGSTTLSLCLGRTWFREGSLLVKSCHKAEWPRRGGVMEELAGEKREGPQSGQSVSQQTPAAVGAVPGPSGQWARELPRSGDPRGIRQGAALLCRAAEAPGGQAPS